VLTSLSRWFVITVIIIIALWGTSIQVGDVAARVVVLAQTLLGGSMKLFF